jgi:2-(1,2-epoxy-1,2-dihydrophenyl)acetyl-CoA isomerase
VKPFRAILYIKMPDHHGLDASLHTWLDNGVAWLRLNRPARRNAITPALRAELATRLPALADDPSVRCVVLTGAGDVFCAGADFAALSTLSQETEEESRTGLRLSVEHYTAILQALRCMPKPTIAALNGPAAGVGASLVLACDLRYAVPAAALALPFVRLGLSPDGGASWSLPRLVGSGRALELLLTGERLSASDAERLGVFNRVVGAEDLQAVVGELAASFARGPADAIARTKQAVRDAEALSYVEAVSHELELQAPLRTSADFREGVAAALERRPPQFQAYTRAGGT